MAKKWFFAAIAVATLSLSACSGGGSGPATVTVTESAADESTGAAGREGLPGLGEESTSRGATILINSLQRVDTMEICADGYECGSRPNETSTARAGGEFLILNSAVTNDSKGPMDLTCGLPIKTEVLNTAGQAYSTVDSLYRIPGNPECNEQLQPGFTEEMMWVFEIPVGTELDYFAFREINDDFNGETAYISLADAEASTPPTPSTTAAATPAAQQPVDPAPVAPPMPETPTSEIPVESPTPTPAAPVIPEAPAPVIGMTEAPGVAQPSVMNKTIQSCGDISMHETGTTFFTDGTSGWTRQCSNQMMAQM